MQSRDLLTSLLEDPRLRKIVKALEDCTWKSFREIRSAVDLDVSDSTLFTLLRKLEHAGIVTSLRLGTCRVYRLTMCIGSGQESSEGDPCANYFTKIVRYLVEYIRHLESTARGSAISIVPGKFLRWLEERDGRFVKCVRSGRPMSLIMHVIEHVHEKCPECFYDLSKRRKRKVAIIRREYVDKIVQILESLIS